MKRLIVLFFLSLLCLISLSTPVTIRWDSISDAVDHFLVYKSTYSPDPTAPVYSMTGLRNYIKDDVDPDIKIFYRVDEVLKDGSTIKGKWFQVMVSNERSSFVANRLNIISFDGITLKYSIKSAFDTIPRVKVLLGGNMELDNTLLMQKNNRWIYVLNIPQYATKPYLEFHVVSEDENGNRCDTLMIAKKKTNVISYSALYGTYPFPLYVLGERLSKSEYRLVCFGSVTPFFKEDRCMLSNEDGSYMVDLTPFLYLDQDGKINLNYRYASLKDGKYDLKITVRDVFDNLYEKTYSLFALSNVLFPTNRKANMKFVLIPPYDYEIKPKDNLYRISIQFDTTVSYLQMINNIRDVNLIYDGEHIKIGKVEFGDSPILIVIDEALSKLYVYYNGALIKQFPVAIGRNNDTPLGRFWIIKKLKNPTLYWKGEIIKPLSPINGLGSMYLQLSSPEYGIHGTTKPWEIGKRISHGCIRMYNEDVKKLAKIVGIGTKVMIIRSDCEMPLFTNERKLKKFISRK